MNSTTISKNRLRILHTSDIHLGAKVAFLNERASEYRGKLVQTFESIYATATKNKVQLVIISGDLFDNPFPSRTSIEIAKTLFKKLVDDGVYVAIIPGNHDYMAEGGVFASGQLSIGNEKLIIFNDPNNQKFVIDELGVVLYAKANIAQKSKASPLPRIKSGPEDVTKQSQENSEEPLPAAVKTLKAQTSGAYSSGSDSNNENNEHSDYYKIAIAHGSVDVKGNQADNFPIRSQDIANSGFDYVALGDWHSTLDASAGQVKAFYPGSIEPLAIDQMDSGSVLLVEIADGQTTVKPIKIGRFRILNLEVNIAIVENIINSIDKKIAEFCQKNDVKDNQIILNVTFTGLKEVGKGYDINELSDYFYTKVFSVRFKDQSNLKIDKSIIDQYPDYTLVGKFIAYIREKKGLDEKLKEDALDKGMRMLTGAQS